MFGWLWTILIVIVVALIVLAIVNRQALMRILGAARAQTGKLGRLAEKADPLALLQQAVDDGVSTLQHAKKGLEDCRALVRSVQRQVESGEKEKARLESRIQAVLAQGDPNHTAKEYALQLAEVERQLAINRQQLAKHEETYGNFAKQVEIGQKRVVEARRRAEELGIALEQSQREKELSQFASNFTFDPQGLTSGAAHAEELIRQQIDKNRAAGDVAVDLSRAALAQAADEETEREAEAAKILERFQKPQG
jgi:phage shock protein A